MYLRHLSVPLFKLTFIFSFCFCILFLVIQITVLLYSAPPSINNVRIFGDAIEGNTIIGAGEYFGGKEGPSKFEWLRESKETGCVT